MNMGCIQSRLFFRKINNKQNQSRLFSKGFDKHLIICWRNWYTTAFVGSEVNLSFGNFQFWCNALKLLVNPFLVCIAAVLSGSTMISIEGTLSINLLKLNKAAVHQQLLKRLFFSTLHKLLSQTNWAGRYTADYELQSGEGGKCCLTWDSPLDTK